MLGIFLLKSYCLNANVVLTFDLTTLKLIGYEQYLYRVSTTKANSFGQGKLNIRTDGHTNGRNT